MSLPTASIRSDIRSAWRGPSLLVVEPDGSAGGHALTGYFFRQTRFLRELRFEINGAAAHACSIAEVSPQELEVTYIFPEVGAGGGGGSGSGGLSEQGGILHRDLDIHLRYRIRSASLEATVRLASRWQDDLEVRVGWRLSADYASVDEALFGTREQTAAVDVRTIADGVVFHYRHPGLPFETRITAAGEGWQFGEGRLERTVVLRRQEVVELELVVRAHDAADPIDAAAEARRDAAVHAWQAQVTELYAPGETPLVGITNDAVRDIGSLALLEGPEEEWLVPAAGIPLYQAMWGRDALTATWQSGLFDGGAAAASVVTYLARMQGTRVDPAADEEPGRILNQAKRDPLTRLGQTPFGRYYADVASPFMFLITLGHHHALTGDRAFLERHWAAALRVLEWARVHGDRDGDGYVEYLTKAPAGPRHQAWKDSDNAVVHSNGEQAAPPIASSEIQGYYYASLQLMAVLSVAMDERDRAAALWRQAAALKERFNRDFWMDDEGFIASGLDAQKRQIRAVTSNAGQCLPTGIVSDEHVARLVRRLFESDLFSGWGIRTLSTRNPAYNPLDYHLGTVWPVENASLLFGLRRYGFDDRVIQLARGLYDLARLWPGGRTPECVGGYGREEAAHPGAYPRANAPQTWNQSVWPLVVQSLLGIVPFAPLRLLVVDPILPSWLPELSVKRLRVGDASVSLRFRRDADGVSRYEITEQSGDLHVLHQPWIQSFSADLWDRLGGLVDTIRHRPQRRTT